MKGAFSLRGFFKRVFVVRNREKFFSWKIKVLSLLIGSKVGSDLWLLILLKSFFEKLLKS